MPAASSTTVVPDGHTAQFFGLAESQAMRAAKLQAAGLPWLCAKHKIYPEIKVVPVWEINRVFEKLDGAARARHTLLTLSILTRNRVINMLLPADVSLSDRTTELQKLRIQSEHFPSLLYSHFILVFCM